MHRLYQYWGEWPPTHECVRLAWLKVEKPKTPDQMDGATAAVFAGIGGNWRGRKPFTVDEFERLSEEYKRGRNE